MVGSAVVFVRIGWMQTYEGSRTKEVPVGGGKNNQLGLGGNERDNFLPDAFGRLHGYFAIGTGQQRINLFRVDGRPESRELDAVSPVLVIFVATRPKQRGAVIVGWYRSALLHRAQRKLQSGRLERVEASAGEAVLIPSEHREHVVPTAASGVSGIGQSNIFYLFEPDGRRRLLPWAEAAVKYAMEYSGPNALQPGVVDASDPLTAAEVEQEQQAGFTSNPMIRKAVEEHAMTIVEDEYGRGGFKLDNRHATEPYDFRYSDGVTQRYIEVKGSRQSARDHPDKKRGGVRSQTFWRDGTLRSSLDRGGRRSQAGRNGGDPRDIPTMESRSSSTRGYPIRMQVGSKADELT